MGVVGGKYGYHWIFRQCHADQNAESVCMTPKPKIPIHRITGRAGTGKTTYLLNEIEKLLEAGVHPKSIALVTLTNAGADVFRERAINKFNFRNSDTLFFKTLHKICWNLGGFSNDNKFTTEHKNKFLEAYYPHSEDKIIEYDLEKFFIPPSDRYKLDNTSRINKMIEIDELLMNLMIDDFNWLSGILSCSEMTLN
uniref:ATP-dependent DNA helicase Rep n=1 Tax=Candidatus Methanogaster sp. ANME-2c ERB4 TaxID=2759911 RepID=A0A7G9YH94_9EURY|nr:ATP-dependent DNA helicase Rep [Methanosarcinales archaeon ANME-2c ERB4]